jgi:8-oxo-dGTP pyrophosphatase MutT (NUDIX family)
MRFMPGVLVFPGGRVDRADHVPRPLLHSETQRLLELSATPSLARALAVCAARELQEETGLSLTRWTCCTTSPAPSPRPTGLSASTRASWWPRRSTRTARSRAPASWRRWASSPSTRSPGQPTARITDMVVEEFRAWLAAPGQRPLHRIMGRDNRRPERSARLP